MMIRGISILMLGCVSFSAMCQQSETPMADTMRSEGKIYVVVAMILTILIGLFVYLFFLQRKLRSLEKRVSGKLPDTNPSS